MAFNEDLQEIKSYLNSQKIFLDFEEFKFQIETHPDFPSLLAFSDTLSFLNIPNIASKISNVDIDNLPDEFIAIIKNESGNPILKHIVKRNEFYYYQINKIEIKSSIEDFTKIWQNIVLIVEHPEEVGFAPKKSVFYIFLTIFFILTLSIIYLFSESLFLVIFSCFTFTGILLSIEALKAEFGIESKVSYAFCSSMSNADCSQVINSNKISLFNKIKISDISLWFFSSQIITILIFSISNFSKVFFSYTFACLQLSIPLTIYSLYFQYKIEKKWCPICLSIIGLLYMQFILLFYYVNDFIINFKLLYLFIFIFGIVAYLIYLIKPTFVEKVKLKESYMKELRFSKNYEIFKNNLVKSATESFENEMIILGNSKAEKKITILTSPLCGHCYEVHKTLHKLYTKYSNEVAISIRFNFYKNISGENLENLLIRLVEIYNNKGDLDFIQALDSWFEIKDFDNWFSQYGKPINDIDMVKYQLERLTEENNNKELNFTPNIFLNQYNYPKQYDRKKLEYFIADWIEDDLI